MRTLVEVVLQNLSISYGFSSFVSFSQQPVIQLILVIKNTDISLSTLLYGRMNFDIFPNFLYISTLHRDRSNYWYLKVNFLGPENLL